MAVEILGCATADGRQARIQIDAEAPEAPILLDAGNGAGWQPTGLSTADAQGDRHVAVALARAWLEDGDG